MAYIYTGDYNYDYGLGAYGLGNYVLGDYGLGNYAVADYGLGAYAGLGPYAALGNYALANYGVNNYSTFLPYCNAPVAVDSALYQPKRFQEVYYTAEPAPQVQVVQQRLPEPPPDVIDRVVVVRQPKQVVYQVVEVPKKPPPVVRERFVHQPPNPPICGGTYRVQLPPNANGRLGKLPQSASTIQVLPSYVDTVAPFIQTSTSFVQPRPPVIQRSTSYIQPRPSTIQTAVAPDIII
jgi:hypothetical protein